MAKKKESRPKRKIGPKKDCFFCKEKKEPTFKDLSTLSKFLTERGKIVGRSRSGLCARHQREFEKQVKHARHLAMLSFTSKD